MSRGWGFALHFSSAGSIWFPGKRKEELVVLRTIWFYFSEIWPPLILLCCQLLLEYLYFRILCNEAYDEEERKALFVFLSLVKGTLLSTFLSKSWQLHQNGGTWQPNMCKNREAYQEDGRCERDLNTFNLAQLPDRLFVAAARWSGVYIQLLCR